MAHRTIRFYNSNSAVEIVRKATDAGRTIIPFLGAGLSAASGFPLINELRDYLCKVRFLIEGGVYRHFLGEDPNWPRRAPHGPDSPQFHPSRYIDSFGWPDLNQLDADLWSFFIDEANRKQSNDCEQTTIEKRIEIFRQTALQDAFKKYDPLKSEKLWGKGRWCLQSAIQHVIIEDIQFHDSRLASSIIDQVWSLDLIPRIDWFRYMLDLAGGRRALVDSLFSQLNKHRQPSLAHTVLAHLSIEFGWRLHLTINFDTLLESAFRQEGLAHTVFEVSREAEPPDPTLVRRAELALIKLHGGSFDLRIGESIDHSLDESTREHMLGCVPEDALLLVIGFSGYERRMMQLIEQIAMRKERSHNEVRVLWLRWESELPPTVRNLEQKLIDIGRGIDFRSERISDAGMFLLETYQALSATLPYTKKAYAALPKRIVHEFPESKEKTQCVFQFFVRKSLLDNATQNNQSCTNCPGVILDSNAPSLSMSAFLQGRNQYHTIWIDLEDHHDVSGIVGEIIEKMRAFDLHLPQLVLPVDDVSSLSTAEQSKRFEKSIRYICRALRRGRYILAFDSIEGFGREQTAHHGLPTDFSSDAVDDLNRKPQHLVLREIRLKQRLGDLFAFFQGLLDSETEYCDWHCCFSADEPVNRHITQLPSGEKVSKTGAEEVREQIRRFADAFTENAANRKINCVETELKNYVLTPETEKDPIARFLARLSELDRGGEEALEQIKELQKAGWSSGDDEIQRSLQPILNTDILATKEHALGAFLVLTVFRRPRSVSAVFGVLTDLFSPTANAIKSEASARAWAREALTLLQKNTVPLVKAMDGGYYWIPRHLHENSYKLLSEAARHQVVGSIHSDWTNRDWEDSTGDFCQGEKRAERLMYLILVHSRIARYYYIHAYKRSHDIAGLHEALYHRITALKYVITLRKLLVSKPVSDSANGSSADKIGKMAVEWCRKDGLLKMGVAKIALSQAIELAHRSYLQRLLNILTREEATIVSRGIADTWLSWIDMLRTDVQRVDNATRSTTPKPTPYVDSAMRETMWMLDKLKAQLLREKGARRRCSDHLLSLMYDMMDRMMRSIEDFLPRMDGSSELQSELKSTVESWSSRKVENSQENNPVQSLIEKMKNLVDSARELFQPHIVQIFFQARDLEMELAAQDVVRFFWCFRNCCACLRYDLNHDEIDAMLCDGATWARDVSTLLGKMSD